MKHKIMNFVEELKWRGILHNITPGTEEQLQKEKTTAYIGFDPTADSLHIGSLASILMLKRFQMTGHKPLALVGGATGMIGDPSGKSKERNLLTEDDLRKNQAGIQKQLEQFLDFETTVNPAQVVNNFDWMKDWQFLDFIRDVGKYITVNYMMAKDSVKKRLETGISFTEFSYQLVQGYDFYYLYKNHNCKLQMGGSDQWGNITTGTEMIRRMDNGEAYALTCPLVTKADGGKFGKTEDGNIWLDKTKTSPYKFFQFWMQTGDEDAVKFIKVFTLHPQQETDNMIAEHNKQPHLRLLQKKLAEDLTIMVHGQDEYDLALKATEILFGKGTTEMLNELPEQTLLNVFEGVPSSNITNSVLNSEADIAEVLCEANVYQSKNEARRALKNNGVSINKQKIDSNKKLTQADLLQNKYILAQKGKRNYHLLIVE